MLYVVLAGNPSQIINYVVIYSYFQIYHYVWWVLRCYYIDDTNLVAAASMPLIPTTLKPCHLYLFGLDRSLVVFGCETNKHKLSLVNDMLLLPGWVVLCIIILLCVIPIYYFIIRT